MIKYKLKKNDSETTVFLRTKLPNQKVNLEFDGKTADEIADWLYYEHGRNGHLIGESTTAVDLSSALSKQTQYQVTLIEGQIILDKYADTTPKERIT